MSKAYIEPRTQFLQATRRPVVYFYTSNEAKFLQASLIFGRSGLPLRQFARTAPYDEDYTGTKEQLLEKAVADVTNYVGHASLVFVEDTTIRIEALSSPREDLPGLRSKEWFETNKFTDVDAQLRARGNDRRAAVKSGIALHVPGLKRPILVSAESRGVVADTAPTFSESPIHPWLTPNSFNGWFIPEGADQRRLGEMEMEESLEFDFRVKAFATLLDRIEELSAGLNLPQRAFVYQAEAVIATGTLSLFPKSLYMIVGPTCAGKTTSGEFLESRRGYQMIEASSEMRRLAKEAGISGDDSTEVAKRLIEKRGADVIAREIASRIVPDTAYVISGFRLLEEVEYIRSAFPEAARTILVDAPERVRLTRVLERARSRDAVVSIQDLRDRDREQESFGLLQVARRVAEFAVENVGTKEDLYQRLLDIVDGASTAIPENVGKGNAQSRDQLVRCLRVLARERRPMSCDEISANCGAFGKPIRHNNVNKILKKAPYFARRLDHRGSRVMYEILPAGDLYVNRSMKSTGARES